jgi:hypothetical protein
MADAVSVLVALAPDPRSGWGVLPGRGAIRKAFYMALAAYGRLVADDRGASRWSVQEILEHATPVQMARYSHLGVAHIRADLERLTRLVSPPTSGEKGGAAAHGMAQLASNTA